MKKPSARSVARAGLRSIVGSSALAGAVVLALGCSEGNAEKSWSSLATCLAGKSASGTVVERFQTVRLLQLASPANPPKDAWPTRCAPLADELFAALPTSGSGSMLRRKLADRSGCKEEKGSCKFVVDPSLLAITTELWESAKDSGLAVTEPAAGVPVPEVPAAPLFDAKSWKSFSAKPVRISGPAVASEGRALVVLKPERGRARPTACEFSDGFSKLRCLEANPKMPELPAHTLEVVNDAQGVFAAGLTEKGLVAYDLQTGAESQVRGRARQLIRDGVAVEPFAKADATAQPPPGGAPPAVKEEGFIAVRLKGGKAARDVKLPIANGVGDPISVGDHIVYLTRTGDGVALNAKGLPGGLKNEAVVNGPFSGAFHTCVKGSAVAVATYAGRSGLGGAKATAPDGKTQLTLALFRDGVWGKALEASFPFDRAYESDLVCTENGASLTWVRNIEGGVQVGRVDCAATGCTTSDVKLPGVDSKWWWLAAPIGDKVLMLWRSTFGETRQRFAALSELPAAKDTLVFDSPDFGGPNAGELSPVIGDGVALLIFRGEQPVALHAGRDGALRLLAP
jgi:hypothetical protein